MLTGFGWGLCLFHVTDPENWIKCSNKAPPSQNRQFVKCVINNVIFMCLRELSNGLYMKSDAQTFVMKYRCTQGSIVFLQPATMLHLYSVIIMGWRQCGINSWSVPAFESWYTDGCGHLTACWHSFTFQCHCFFGFFYFQEAAWWMEETGYKKTKGKSCVSLKNTREHLLNSS